MQLATSDTAVIDYINGLKNNFEKRYQELETKNRALENSLKQSAVDYEILHEKYKLLLFHRFSRSSEKYAGSKDQRLLFNEGTGEPPKAEQKNETTAVKAHQRKKCGRKPLDPKLPRELEYIDIPEHEKTCACGAKLTRIGEETSEKLEIIPQQIFVRKTIRYKYACRCCEGTADETGKTVKTAPVPPEIIPRSIASASMLAFSIVHKYQDHIPYYRQERQFRRIGVEISRQDMSNWQQQVFNRLAPLFSLLKAAVKSGPVIRMDETTAQVMGEEGKGDTSTSYMWLARGGPDDAQVVWYEYHPSREAANAYELLEGYCGYLQTDGYEAYEAAVKNLPGIKHAGCFAHARRKFFEAVKVSGGSPLAEEALQYIKNLYAVERDLRGQNLSEGIFLEKRKAESEPIVTAFKEWLRTKAKEVPPSGQLGKAVLYTLRQWDKLVVYLETAHLTPDNNACENAIRPFVLGRKNWMFNKSPDGAQSSCGMFTLIETAKLNNIEPLFYLQKLFERAPYVSSPQEWEALLPWNISSK